MLHHILILRSGPKDRVSKDAKSDLQADLAFPNGTLGLKTLAAGILGF